MKAFVAGIPDRALPMPPLLQVGEPRPLIIRPAETLGVDLIVIGAHSKPSFLRGGCDSQASRMPSSQTVINISVKLAGLCGGATPANAP